VPTRGIPFPAGDPSLDPEAEKAWRRRLLDRALEAVSTVVHRPTIFSVDDATAAEPEGAHA
jgi:glycine reductase